jgi:hypothetical protein
MAAAWKEVGGRRGDVLLLLAEKKNDLHVNSWVPRRTSQLSNQHHNPTLRAFPVPQGRAMKMGSRRKIKASEKVEWASTPLLPAFFCRRFVRSPSFFFYVLLLFVLSVLRVSLCITKVHSHMHRTVPSASQFRPSTATTVVFVCLGTNTNTNTKKKPETLNIRRNPRGSGREET